MRYDAVGRMQQRSARPRKNFGAFWLIGTSVCTLGAGGCVLAGAFGVWLTRMNHALMVGADPITVQDLEASGYIVTTASIGSLAIAFTLVVAASVMGAMAWFSRARPA